MAKKKNVEQKKVHPRRAIFALSPQAFMSLFSGEHHYSVSENPIPPGSVVVDVRMERWSERGAIEVLLEHPSIPELVDGQAVPYVKPPTFKSLVPTRKK